MRRDSLVGRESATAYSCLAVFMSAPLFLLEWAGCEAIVNCGNRPQSLSDIWWHLPAWIVLFFVGMFLCRGGQVLMMRFSKTAHRNSNEHYPGSSQRVVDDNRHYTNAISFGRLPLARSTKFDTMRYVLAFLLIAMGLHIVWQSVRAAFG